MIDIDKFRIDVECPKCNFGNNISLKQVRIGDVVICRGCNTNLQLHDQMASFHKVKRDIRRSLNSLFAELGKIGNISIG